MRFNFTNYDVETHFDMEDSSKEILYRFLVTKPIVEPVDNEGNILEDIVFKVDISLLNEKGKWLVKLWPFDRPVGGYEFGANVTGTAHSDRLEIDTEGEYERDAKFICFYRQKPAE